MSNSNSYQSSPLNHSGSSLRSFYSSPNHENLSSSPPNKVFLIKSKLAPTKIQSSTSIQQLLESNPQFLPGKQGIVYRKNPQIASQTNLTPKPTYFNPQAPKIKLFNSNSTKLISLQNIPLKSESLIRPKDKAPLAKLKPLNRHFLIKIKKNQELLEELLQKQGDEVDEDPASDTSLTVEENKEEEESSPLRILVKKSMLIPRGSLKGLQGDILNLVNHNLKDEILEGFLCRLEQRVKRVFLANNCFGALACKSLVAFMGKQGDSQLIELDLEENQMNDTEGIALFNVINRMRHLRIVNLTGNFLSHHSSPELKTMIASNTSIKELYLRRNKLSGVAASHIFQGLLLNSSLKVLDLSWNILTTRSCAEALCKLIVQDSCSLVHLDLSYNNFSLKEAGIIAESLALNHRLYGFHFEGNYGFVDVKGFLKIPEKFKRKLFNNYETSRRIKGIGAKIGISKGDNNEEENELGYRDCCWLCEGWQEMCFELSVDELSDLPEIKAVFLHLEVEGFHGIPMKKPSKKASKYVVRKVLPTEKKTCFFFTVNDLQITSERFYTIKNPNPTLKNILIGELLFPEVEMPELNFIEPTKKEAKHSTKGPSYNPGYFEDIRERSYSILGGKVPNVRFVLGSDNTIIEGISPAKQQAVKLCFENDYKNTRIPQLCTDISEENKVKGCLLRYYSKIKDIYHYLSALAPNPTLLSINMPLFSEFAKICNLIDDKFLRISDIEVIFFTAFISTTKLQAESAAKSNKLLLRCQFIETLVKLSLEKFVRVYNIPLYEALERLLLENIFPGFSSLQGEEWRASRLNNESYEILLKKYWDLLEHLFKAFVVVTNPNKQLLMGFPEFKSLIETIPSLQKNLSEKELLIAFRLSTGFHSEDLLFEIPRSLYLNFQEFQEALARVAEGSNLIPFGEKELDTKWTLKARTSLPLVVKFEALLQALLKKLGLGERFPGLLTKKSGFVDEIKGVLEVQNRESIAGILLKNNENKTFIRSNLQKALLVTVLTKKIEVKCLKEGARESIDTPYH